MTINLANDYNNDFGRSFPITGTDFIFEGDECFAQTSTGIVYEHKGKEYEAPFTIYCFEQDDLLFIQLSEISENDVVANVIQFGGYKEIVDDLCILEPVSQAYKFICHSYPNFSYILTNVLWAIVGDVVYPERKIQQQRKQSIEIMTIAMLCPFDDLETECSCGFAEGEVDACDCGVFEEYSAENAI